MIGKSLIPAAILCVFIFICFQGETNGMNGDEKQKEEVGRGAKPCRFDNLPRPSILLTKDRLTDLKKEIASQKWKKEIYEGIVKFNADLWVDREINLPERTGHFHRFFCTDGVKLEIPDEKTQKFTSREYKRPACGKIYTGEPYEGGRRWLENRWRYFACRDLALAYVVNGDKRYAKKAAEILIKYADAYPGRHTTHLEGGICYQSLCEAVMMIPLAQAYDLICDSGVLSDEDKKRIEYDFFWESAEGLVKMGIGGNWGSWHLCAVGTIGLATRHQRFIDHGISSFKSQIEKQSGSDGLWPESVHTYHFYPLSAFVHFAEACANTGEDLYNWKAENGHTLKSMFTAPISYMYPDARLPAINDGWYESWLRTGQYEAAYYRYREPELAGALLRSYRGMDRGAGFDQEQFHDEPWVLILGAEIPKDTPALLLKSIDFDNLGVCVLRTGNPSIEKEIALTFDYGRFLGHGQLDKMGVTLFAEGRVMAADYGTPGYGSAILPYYTGSLSHNIIMVDGKNQEKTRKGKLSVFHDTPILKAARSETDEAYPGVKWTRTVMLTDSYVAIIDDLESAEDHLYDCFFHSEGDELKLEGCATSPTLAETLTYSYISEVNGLLPERELGKAVWIFKDGATLSAWFEQTPGLQLFSAQTPAETGARTVPLLILRRKSKTARFLTILFPKEKDVREEPEILGTKPDELTIMYQNKKDILHVGNTFSMERK
jgi:hypothetical protein